jgi:hypothetical protein
VIFEPTIPAFERVKIVHALGRAVTVIGHIRCNYLIFPNDYDDGGGGGDDGDGDDCCCENDE